MSGAVEHYAAQFGARQHEDPEWLGTLRVDAMERFRRAGFPTPRLEEWKYTNVAPLAKIPFEVAGEAPRVDPELSREDVERIAYPVFACSAFVFVNGRHAPKLSALATSIPIRSLAAAVEEKDPLARRLGERAPRDHAFAALNTAFCDDGAVIGIPREADPDSPIHLVFITAPGEKPVATHPRILIEAAAGSRATIVEDYVTLDGVQAFTSFTNPITEISLGENAELQYLKLQRENEETFHVSGLYVNQERDSRFAGHTVTFGTRITRNDAVVSLAAEGAQCSLDGLFAAAGAQHVDNNTCIDHTKPHGTSRELYKGILGGSSRGAFNGKIIVRPDAQKTDAKQRNANLLMSRKAEIDTKPQLEIYADDVKCAHGSTVGHLDEDALFYLRSRGLEEHTARGVLTRGFAAEVTRAITVEPLRERIEEILLERLADAGSEAA